jgi:hypothetical protein
MEKMNLNVLLAPFVDDVIRFGIRVNLELAAP